MEEVEKCSEFGIRWGHFYSKRMVDNLLGLREDGIVRVSMVHYNTGKYHYLGHSDPLVFLGTRRADPSFLEEEIHSLVKVLEKVLA